MNPICKSAVTLALAGFAAAAFAGVKASHTYAGNWSTSTPAAVLVPLNSTGANSINFNLSAAGKKILTYSAECAVNTAVGSSGAWLDLDVIVNGVVVAPTAGTSDAFCTSNGTAGSDGWVRASITVAITGKKGANTVQIQARGNNSATGLWLGDTSLVVHD